MPPAKPTPPPINDPVPAPAGVVTNPVGPPAKPRDPIPPPTNAPVPAPAAVAPAMHPGFRGVRSQFNAVLPASWAVFSTWFPAPVSGLLIVSTIDGGPALT